MKDKIKKYTSLIGTVFTAACCQGLPVIISALSAIGLGFLIHDVILIPLYMGFIGFNLWMLQRAANKQEACATEIMTPFKLAAAGGTISILGLFLSVAGLDFATLLIYIGLGCFLLVIFEDLRGVLTRADFLTITLDTGLRYRV